MYILIVHLAESSENASILLSAYIILYIVILQYLLKFLQ